LNAVTTCRVQKTGSKGLMWLALCNNLLRSQTVYENAPECTFPFTKIKILWGLWGGAQPHTLPHYRYHSAL